MESKKLLVQPHSDDIILSLYHLLKTNEPENLEILTIENDEKRLKEEIPLYKELGINFTVFPEILPKDDSYGDFFKAHKQVDSVNAISFFQARWGIKPIDTFMDYFPKYLEYKKQQGFQIWLPLGAGNAYHKLVTEAGKEKVDFFYRDWPHSYKRRGMKQMEEEINKGEYGIVYEAEEEYLKEKFDVFYKFYKSQRSLLWFEKSKSEKYYTEQVYFPL